MGRSSVDATNASFSRFVRAIRSALVPRCFERRLAALPPLPRLPRLLAVALALLAFPALEWFLSVLLFLCIAEVDDAPVESPELCAATGPTEISAASRPARHRAASPREKVGEMRTLMHSLYADFSSSDRDEPAPLRPINPFALQCGTTDRNGAFGPLPRRPVH